MFTSDTDNVKRWMDRGIIFTFVSVFCALFGAVYEVYSHGVYSYSMIYAFAYPLVFGAVPSLVMARLKRPCRTCAAFDFYVFAIAAATVGSIVSGVLEIYGTSSRLTVLFPILCAVMTALAVIFAARDVIRRRRTDA